MEIKEYLRQNMGKYIFIAALFMLGILVGTLTMRGLDESHRIALNQYFSLFVDSINDAEMLTQGAIFRQTLKNNFQYLFLCWVLGIFSYGFPFICALVALRGFSVGFTVGFLVERASYRGMLFALGSVLPHNLLIIPSLLVIGMTAFSLSWLRFRSHLQKRPCSLRELIAQYTIMIFLAGLALFAGVLIEAYLSPVFIRILIPMMR
jgi:stage II sporulation protein M